MIVGPSSKPHPIERPKPVASSPEAPAEAAPNSRETQITSLCSKGDLPADASIAGVSLYTFLLTWLCSYIAADFK